MAYTVFHTQLDRARPYWYQLDTWRDREQATKRARRYAMDHGGYVYVKDCNGNIVSGTDPVELDRAIADGRNRHFTQTAGFRGACVVTLTVYRDPLAPEAANLHTAGRVDGYLVDLDGALQDVERRHAEWLALRARDVASRSISVAAGSAPLESG